LGAGDENVDKRLFAFAKLELDHQQEAKLISWQLMPDRPDWWKVYLPLRDEFAAARHRNSDTCSPPSSSDIALQHMQPSVQSPQPSSPPVT